MIGLDFNTEAFLDLSSYGSMDELADAIMALEADPIAWRRLRDQPPYVDDKLPDCANEEKIFAFFDTIFETAITKRTFTKIVT